MKKYDAIFSEDGEDIEVVEDQSGEFYKVTEVDELIANHARHATKMMWFPDCLICEAERAAEQAEQP